MKHLERPWDLFLVIEPPRPPSILTPSFSLKDITHGLTSGKKKHKTEVLEIPCHSSLLHSQE